MVPMFLVPSVAGLRHHSHSAAQSDTPRLPATSQHPPHSQPTSDPRAAAAALVTAAAAPPRSAAAARGVPFVAADAGAGAAAAAARDADEMRVQELQTLAANLT